MTRHLLAAALLLKCVGAAACPLCLGWGQPSTAQRLVSAPRAVLAVPTEDANRFRVIQVIEPIGLNVSQDYVRAEGLAGGPYDRERFWLEVVNPGEQTVDDLDISADVDWLEVEGVAPKQVLPGSTVMIPVRLTATPDTPGVSLAPSGASVVPGWGPCVSPSGLSVIDPDSIPLRLMNSSPA